MHYSKEEVQLLKGRAVCCNDREKKLRNVQIIRFRRERNLQQDFLKTFLKPKFKMFKEGLFFGRFAP